MPNKGCKKCWAAERLGSLSLARDYVSWDSDAVRIPAHFTPPAVGSNIMRYDTEIKIIQQLLDISEVVEGKLSTDIGSWASFDLGQNNISFIGDDKVNFFYDSLEKLYSLDYDIANTISKELFKKKLIKLIRNLKKRDEKCSIKILQSFNTELKGIELKEFEVLYALNGIENSDDTRKVIFGIYNVYYNGFSNNYLKEKYSELESRKEFLDKNINHLLGIKVLARDRIKAIEIAEKLCNTFEYVINYMIADLHHIRSIGVSSYRGSINSEVVVCNNSSLNISSSSTIAYLVNISDSFFKDVSLGNDKIWDLLKKSQLTEIEKRLINSIEWIGKAVLELDKSKSLIQFVIAIESMLHYDEKAFVTPSIVSQLSDSLAFITKSDFEERKAISKSFKDIYQKRSAISHGASKKILFSDLETILSND